MFKYLILEMATFTSSLKKRVILDITAADKAILSSVPDKIIKNDKDASLVPIPPGENMDSCPANPPKYRIGMAFKRVRESSLKPNFTNK